jgi:3-oxoacyl-[acyl-carrier protein] reductase
MEDTGGCLAWEKTMDLGLTDKRIFVTGGSRGIGRAIGEGFAAEGARVAICARSAEAVEEVRQALAAAGAADVLAFVADVASTPDVNRCVTQIVERWGGVDVLVNNAGQSMVGGIEDIVPEDLLVHANTLQVAHFRVAQAVVPHMRAQHWGRIIDINAVVGVNPAPAGIPAVINRAACVALSRSLAMALGPDNILVNTLNMGWIETGQWEKRYAEIGEGVSRDEFFAMANKVVPLGRFGKPEDVVGMALFLASDRANYITGASIDIAGGLGGQIAYYPTMQKEMRELSDARLAAGESRP